MSDRRSHARALFEPLGPTYDRVGAVLSLGQDPRWRRFLVSRIPADGGEVLDVATGTGLVAEALVRRGLSVTGVDQSPGMLAQARARLGRGVELVEASAESLPFPDESFDHLTFTYLLRYVDDPAATLVELARVVRPGGTIAMLEFGVPRGVWHRPWDALLRPRPPVCRPGGLARLARRRPLSRPLDPRLPRPIPGAAAAAAVAGRRRRATSICAG